MEKPKKSTKVGFQIGLIALISLVLGGIFQSILDTGGFWQGFIAASLLIFVSGAAMYLLWRAAGAERALGWMMVTAFLLRLGLSVFLTWGLPRFGYDEPPQRAGFVFFDAYQRESQAWVLAQSGDSLFTAFGDELGSDQYGGMLTLSAAIYRYISRDAFRPGLVSIVVAGAFSLSLPFFMAMMKRRFGQKTALWAGWILVLYPEGVLLGASQMREAFFILFIAMLLWSAGQWLVKEKLNLAYFAGLIGMAGLLVFSYRVAISALGLILLWVWFEWTSTRKHQSWRIIRWVVLAVGAVVILLGLRGWLVDAALWDTLQTYRASGRIQFHLEGIIYWLRSPLIWVYGIFQPFLPAAVIHPAPWIWRGIAIYRALGWYLMLPLLIYALFRVWKLPSSEKKRFLIVAIIFVWLWIGISSIRAGGGQWDNPRYRTIFLPLMAALSAWSIHYARQTKDKWMVRGLIIEGIFLGIFTIWYVGRYYRILPILPFGWMIAAIIVLIAGVIVTGWWSDRKRSHEVLPKEK